MDKERIEGFRKAFEPGETYRWEIPKTERERMCFYEDKYMQLLKSNVTAVFAVSDFYAYQNGYTYANVETGWTGM